LKTIATRTTAIVPLVQNMNGNWREFINSTQKGNPKLIPKNDNQTKSIKIKIKTSNEIKKKRNIKKKRDNTKSEDCDEQIVLRRSVRIAKKYAGGIKK